MYTLRNRYRILATLAAIGLTASLVVACGGSGNIKRDAADASSPAASASVIATTSASPPVAAPSAPLTQTAIPDQFNAIRVKVPYRAGQMPVSGSINGTPDVEGYVQEVMRSYRDTWTPTFSTVKLQMPRLAYDTTSRNDRYVSHCSMGNTPIVATASSSWLLYCQADAKPDGAVALPTGALLPLWQNTTRTNGDLTVALSVSRQASLILVASLKWQLSLNAPTESRRYYAAACLAGVWGHSVYDQSAFTDEELTAAAQQSFDVRLQVDGILTDVSAISQSGTESWLAGFHSGDPAECGMFWQ